MTTGNFLNLDGTIKKSETNISGVIFWQTGLVKIADIQKQIDSAALNSENDKARAGHTKFLNETLNILYMAQKVIYEDLVDSLSEGQSQLAQKAMDELVTVFFQSHQEVTAKLENLKKVMHQICITVYEMIPEPRSQEVQEPV